MARLVDLPPDLTDGVHRRNGDPPRERDRYTDERPGMFRSAGLAFASLTIATAALTLLGLGLWKLAELVSRAL